jgi:hypothetical protein
MRNWTYWEWVAYAVLFVAAIIIAADQGIKLAPDIAVSLKGLLASPWWAFSPVTLILLATGILVGREMGWIGASTTPASDNRRRYSTNAEIFHPGYELVSPMLLKEAQNDPSGAGWKKVEDDLHERLKRGALTASASDFPIPSEHWKKGLRFVDDKFTQAEGPSVKYTDVTIAKGK